MYFDRLIFSQRLWHHEIRELADLGGSIVGAHHAGVAAVLAVQAALGLNVEDWMRFRIDLFVALPFKKCFYYSIGQK